MGIDFGRYIKYQQYIMMTAWYIWVTDKLYASYATDDQNKLFINIYVPNLIMISAWLAEQPLYEGCSKWIAYCPLARYPRGAR